MHNASNKRNSMITITMMIIMSIMIGLQGPGRPEEPWAASAATPGAVGDGMGTRDPNPQ